MIYRPDYMDALKAFKDKPCKILTGKVSVVENLQFFKCLKKNL